MIDLSNKDKNPKEIEQWRKTLYYLGMAITGIGILMFLGVFFTMITNPFNGFNSFPLSFIGIVMSGAGQFIMSIGKKGVAGSGLKLDPEEARKDYEPFTRAGGGMIADAYDEFKSETNSKQEPTIKIKCRNCNALNDEDANFCDNCGEIL